MARVEKTIEVHVPVRVAYNQWTQFEEFPQFMEGVEEVHQLDDSHLHWRARVGGHEKEWDAEIREQLPDEKVIWRATGGQENAGMVKFDVLGPELTRVHLEMSYDPEGFTENVGDMLGFFSRRVEGDLRRFKDFIESRGSATGGWRGEIPNPDAPGGHTSGSLDAGEPGRSDGDRLRPEHEQRANERMTGSSGMSEPVGGNPSRMGGGPGSSEPRGNVDPGVGTWAEGTPGFESDRTRE